MNALPNFYEILGLKSKATKQEIQAAYKRLVKKHHPDANFGRSEEHLLSCEQQTKLLNQAYNILSNDQLRQQYDCSLQNNILPQYYSTAQNASYSGFIEVTSEIWDLFESELANFATSHYEVLSWSDFQSELKIIEADIEDLNDQIHESRWQLAILEENFAGHPSFKARRREMIQHLHILKLRLKELKNIRLEILEELSEVYYIEDDEY